MINNKFATTYMETGAIAGLPDSHFIGGAWVAGNSGQKMQSYDPALAEAFGEDALGTATDMDNAEHLAFLESLDSGKTLAEAEGDVANSARLFEYYAGAADKLDGHSVNLGAAHTVFTV